MCVVSMVMQQWWPKPEPFEPMKPVQPIPAIPQWPPQPNAIPWPTIEKDPALAAQMLEVLKKLEAIDRRLGLLEQCKVEAGEKKRIKAKLKRIAKKAPASQEVKS